MGIRITDVGYSKVRTDVSHIDAVVNELYYVLAKVQDAVYVDAAVSNLYVDTNTKNRVIRDITAIVDSLILELRKDFSDSAPVNDSNAIAIGKATADIFGISDTFNKGLTKPFTEQLPVFDAAISTINKVLLDTATVYDTPHIISSRNVHDTVSTADAVTKIILFAKHFQEDVNILSDFNVSMGKSIDDLYNVLDIPSIISEIQKVDSITTSDIYNLVQGKLLQNSVVMRSVTAFDTGKYVVDTSSISDNYYVDSAKGISDNLSSNDYIALYSNLFSVDNLTLSELSTLSLNKPESDTVSSADLNFINYGKYSTDTAGTLDKIAISRSKNINDLVATNDVLNYLNISKQVYDSVAIDDDFRALEYVDKVKNNIATTTDSTSIGSNKILTDSTAVIDVPNVSTSKSFNDLTNNIIDSVAINGFKRITNSVIITDDSAINSSYGGITDNSSANDSQSVSLSKVFGDVGIVADSKIFNVTKNTTDNVSAQDSVLIQFSTVASSLFNELIFNNSTFG